MKPLVSVIVPVYNVEKYVLKCLETLRQQTYDKIEIIIVDDGSTDKSGEICNAFVKSDKRAKIFHKENGGLSSARNYGIKKAKGEYVCLVDSDDYVKKEFIEVMVHSVVSNDADIAICGYNSEIPKNQTMTGEEATAKLLVEQNNIEIIAWNKIYRRSFFEDILYPKGRYFEDNLTTYKLLSRAHLVTYVPESLYIYKEREESISSVSVKEEKLKAREDAAKESIDYLKGNYDLEQAADIAMLTAKLAWMDFAINRQVPSFHYKLARKWVISHKERLLKNKFLGKKLKIYITLITRFGGGFYVVFRKIRHE